MFSIAAIAIPFISAVCILLLPGRMAKQFALLSAFVSLAVTVITYFSFDITAAEQFTVDVPWIDSLGISFHIGMDGISLLMIFICNLLMPFIILSSFKDTYKNAAAFYALMLLMQGAMNGVFLSMDMFLYYIFWELALVPAYFLVLRWGRFDTGRITLKFFIYTLLGSLFMLAAIIALAVYGNNASTDIRDIYALQPDDRTQMLVFFAFMLAYAIKIPIFPFHSWQPDTYTSSPAPVTMMLSGIMLKMGLYSVIRWVIPVTPDALAVYGKYIIVLAAIGVLYASMVAWMQKDMKRLFAYASMAHVGLIAAGILTATAIGIQGGLVQMLAHGIYATGLFYAAHIIFTRTGTNALDNSGGIRLKAPLFAGLFLVILLASVSLPLTNAFPGEFMLLNAVYFYNSWICLLAASGVVLGAVYMLGSYQKVMLGETGKHTGSFTDVNLNEKLVLIPLVILIFIFGLFPNIINDLTAPAVNAIVEHARTAGAELITY